MFALSRRTRRTEIILLDIQHIIVTGAEIVVPGHKVLSFTASPAMKDTVNAAASSG
jgi:nucleoid DNA-binding protein